VKLCRIWSNFVIHICFLYFIFLLSWIWNLAVICEGYQHLLGSCSYCSLPWKVPTKCYNYIKNCRCCFILSTYGMKSDLLFTSYFLYFACSFKQQNWVFICNHVDIHVGLWTRLELGWVRASSSRISGWPSSRVWLSTHRGIFHASRSVYIAYGLRLWVVIIYVAWKRWRRFKPRLLYFRRQVPRYFIPATTGFITSLCRSTFRWTSVCSKGWR
jgi:hypothetical protein